MPRKGKKAAKRKTRAKRTKQKGRGLVSWAKKNPKKAAAAALAALSSAAYLGSEEGRDYRFALRQMARGRDVRQPQHWKKPY